MKSAMDVAMDRSTVDALSWRLASELVRRHSSHLFLNREHPGGGLYDCLSIRSRRSPGGSVLLNRNGTIQVHGRFDGGESDWAATGWDYYMRADPRAFLLALESASGLPPPPTVPPSTPAVLTYRVFAVLAALASKTVEPYDFQQAYRDSSGDDEGPNDAIDAFPAAARRLRSERASDAPATESGLRYWMVWQGGRPLLAVERDHGLVWTPRADQPQELMQMYRRSGRRPELTTLSLLATN